VTYVVGDLVEDRLSCRLVEEGGPVVLTVDDIGLETRRQLRLDPTIE